MGLVKTRWRLAEDGSPPPGDVEAAAREGGAEVLPMWECCQFQCCQFSIGDWEGMLATRATFSRWAKVFLAVGTYMSAHLKSKM